MKPKLPLIALVICLALNGHAQVDTLPFTLSKQLLVFTGKINGVAIDFAFDTGAGIGAATSDNLSKTDFKVKSSGKRINDSNKKTAKLSNVLIQDMAIGSHHFSRIKSVLADMEFLQCNGLYLLGMDVISQVNWKINFAKQELYISKQAFDVDESYAALPVSNMNQRPKISFSINEHEYSKCLVDMGYNGIFDIPEAAHINQLYQQKQNSPAASIALSSHMGLTGLGKPDTVKTFLTDSIQFAGQTFTNVPVSVKEKTDLKVGINFFLATCSQLIINNNAGHYYLQYKKEQDFSKKLGFDARVGLVEGKLVITGKNLLNSSTAKSLSINEEIKSINGKKAQDFESSCAFFIWNYYSTFNEQVIEKMDGEKITVQKKMLP